MEAVLPLEESAQHIYTLKILLGHTDKHNAAQPQPKNAPARFRN
jgi:hypothetical protein